VEAYKSERHRGLERPWRRARWTLAGGRPAGGPERGEQANIRGSREDGVGKGGAVRGVDAV
jgi:hypothetical protein